MSKTQLSFTPCGIEVSYKTLLVDRAGSPAREFANTPAGHRSLLAWLRRSRPPVRVCLEATGLYGLDLALRLAAAGIALQMANPRAVRQFAGAMRQRSKTDRLDAAVLREYAARLPFQPWQPPSPPALQLLAVARPVRAHPYAGGGKEPPARRLALARPAGVGAAGLAAQPRQPGPGP